MGQIPKCKVSAPPPQHQTHMTLRHSHPPSTPNTLPTKPPIQHPPQPNQNGALCAPYVFPGARVLIIGAGHGTDAIYCAQNFPEAEVTALDLSPTMLRQLDNRRKKAIPNATNLKLVQGSVFEYEDAQGGYDLVLLNFFLNVFDRKSANRILDRVHDKLLKIGACVR